MTTIDDLVIRFLTWPMPDDVCADSCARVQGYPNRSGTNLLTAAQAKKMLTHVLAGVATAEDAAAWVEARRDAFVAEHGSIDPDTGALEFGRGAQAEAKAEYVGELEEIAHGLRNLKPNLNSQTPPV